MKISKSFPRLFSLQFNLHKLIQNTNLNLQKLAWYFLPFLTVA